MIEKFGKYEVVGKIGSGGFGEVYEARDPAIQRRVAIKTCVAQNEEARARFVQEARLAGNLHHRNLTTIYDFGSQEDLLYLVCEFLPGEDLNAIIERGKPMTIREKVEILIGIAYGLGHAHDAGIVHRDIKPGNIRILPDATVKIMDFGIAKFLYADRILTRTGFTVGTSSYLAPEQVRGEPVDRRTDIFSFGVLAYELLAGARPFVGSTAGAILDAVVKDDPPALTAAASQIPPALAGLVHRTMSKDRESRPASMEPVRRELSAIREALANPTAPPASQRICEIGDTTLDRPAPEQERKPGRRWVVVLVIVAILAAACGLLLWLTPR